MATDTTDLYDSILMNVQLVSLDCPRAADQLRVIGETLGDEMLRVAASFLVAHRLEMRKGHMPDHGLFKWLARTYPALLAPVHLACCLYIEAAQDGTHRRPLVNNLK